MAHPVAGEIPLVASPLRLSQTPVQYRRAPPTLGQDTREVLGDLMGLSAQQIGDLTNQGVIA